MAVPLKRIIPSKPEYIALLPATLLVLFLGNGRQLLSNYGLTGSDQVVRQSTSQAVGSGLTKLDGVSATTPVVTFLIWGMVGILCFSIVQSIGGAYNQVRKDRALVSNRYVRPSNFNTNSFWHRVLLDFAVLASSLLLLGIVLYGLLAVILPLSLQLALGLFTGVSTENLKNFLIGFGLTYIWLLLVGSSVRILIRRRQLAD